jgi:hypothetical protein
MRILYFCRPLKRDCFFLINGDLSEWLKESRSNREKVWKTETENKWRLVRVVEGVPIKSGESRKDGNRKIKGDLSEWLKESRSNREKVWKTETENKWRLVRVVEGVPIKSGESRKDGNRKINGDLSEWLKESRSNREKVGKTATEK